MSEFEEEILFDCPYCGTANAFTIDLTGGQKQQLTYDCSTCCRPMVVKVEIEDGAVAEFFVERES